MAKAFKSLMEPIENRDVLIVDSLNLGFRWKHKGSVEFAEEYQRTVQSLAKSYNCGKVIITADGGASSYRKQIFPEYKGNREDLRAAQTDKEKEDFEAFFREYENTLLQLSLDYPILKYKGVEADDIAAYIVKHRKSLGIDNIWLISSDRDWDLLLSEDVSRFSYVTRKETTLANWRESYEFEIEDYISYKCLTGDKGDNIPGIEGIGPKRATALLAEYGSVFDIYNACPIDGKYVYIKNLNKEYEQLLINVELMDLLTYCEAAIGEYVEDLYQKVLEYING
jgi:5'-3' exonuclease